MTMLMVSILVLVVISLALDVLILATLGDMVSRLFKPKQESERIAKAVKAAFEAAAVESTRLYAERIARRPHYDA
jgi:hypothetical protein